MASEGGQHPAEVRVAELFDALRITFLRTYGFFEPGTAATASWSWFIDGERVTFVATWPADGSSLTITSGSASHGIAVLTGSPRRRTYFRCPISGENCTKLYFVDGRFGNRKAFGLRYKSELITPLQRRTMKRRFGSKIPRSISLDPEVIRFEVIKPPPPRHPTDELGTTWALDRATALPSAIQSAVKSLLRETIERQSHLPNNELPAAEVDWPSALFKSAVFESHPRLTISELRRTGLMIPGSPQPGIGLWNCQLTGLELACFELDVSDPENGRATIQSKIGSELKTQVLQVKPLKANSEDYAFICPRTGKRVKTVALRCGLWGSKEAHNLKNKSQRSARFAVHTATGARDEPRRGLGTEQD